jgi:hypothetical protein
MIASSTIVIAIIGCEIDGIVYEHLANACCNHERMTAIIGSCLIYLSAMGFYHNPEGFVIEVHGIAFRIKVIDMIALLQLLYCDVVLLAEVCDSVIEVVPSGAMVGGS